MKFPQNLQDKLDARAQNSSLRYLTPNNSLIDFASNDYLGFAKSALIFDKTHHFLTDKNLQLNGVTGSRLLTGNIDLFADTETAIAAFHQSETALLFNSGYDANVGFFGAVPQRNDVILFDELSHASIRDGILISKAKSYKFNHNDCDHLEQLLIKFKTNANEVYVVTESVFSMDGDAPNLENLVALSNTYNANLVVDEAHALGVFGDSGQGLVQQLELQNTIFARIMTFGKGLGCHGAAILGSAKLKSFLVNFARSFIYTTGLSPHAVATIYIAYQEMAKKPDNLLQLRNNINFFNQQKQLLSLKNLFVRSKSAIQSALFPGNENVKKIAFHLNKQGFNVKAILSPTVAEGQERLRICLHSYNSEKEILDVLQLLSTFVF